MNKKVKINEFIILSGNILSWTVCVESSCFLSPVGGSLPLPVLCFCSPSVSVVVSCTAARVEAENRWRLPADLGGGAPVQQRYKCWLNFFFFFFKPQKQFEKSTFTSDHYGMPTCFLSELLVLAFFFNFLIFIQL